MFKHCHCLGNFLNGARNNPNIHHENVSSYVAQYPVLRTAQSTLHFTSLEDQFNQTPSQLPWKASSGAAINVPRLLIQISTTVCSQILIHSVD